MWTLSGFADEISPDLDEQVGPENWTRAYLAFTAILDEEAIAYA